jgi:hypothetical protein
MVLYKGLALVAILLILSHLNEILGRPWIDALKQFDLYIKLLVGLY